MIRRKSAISYCTDKYGDVQKDCREVEQYNGMDGSCPTLNSMYRNNFKTRFSRQSLRNVLHLFYCCFQILLPNVGQCESINSHLRQNVLPDSTMICK